MNTSGTTAKPHDMVPYPILRHS